ncbi:MAG: peptidoglycan DD-metalloendopeptidase family protein [Bacteroidales bacterium]|jgi:septal ring factor EnvC (AmiA/AmiB activator)|nr:peptidoglycan DD-metalloendopeptidase family protein [Bacteroidales bacterium]HOL99073.1 peptidoglycan DD-metalloendopeptidase family protein [Bacteroidales bacterium]HOM37460.1 peptidoglycan DD-metalloendopeptidase family protein [Bacteroidales bacterium]HPD24942.1 peptidoglycan DD-metalloendopeptidase family protein [Bacteroidales bacterium]HRT00666.1 peptidoglycan DD-metalloendopeptidase family protein [Bacteroidales bacterium]
MRIYITILLLSFYVIPVFGQTKAELEKKKKKTEEEIAYTNKLLKETRDFQKSSYNNLLLINKNIAFRREMIQNLNYEIELTDKRIRETEELIKMMSEDLERLQKNYAEMIRIAWKNKNKYNDLMFILSAKDFNQMYLRMKYMQQLSSYRERQLKAINSVKTIMDIQVQKLEKVKKQKQDLINNVRSEEDKLTNEMKEQEKIISNLKKQEQNLLKKLKEQQKQMASIQKEIEKLIAEENKRTSGSTTGKYKLTPEEKLVSDKFGNNKGRLPWPVERGVITVRFGRQSHPVLANIEIDSKGVDISTTSGSDARAVFEGEVRRIFAVPGGHNAVIIRHGEYLSVYTNLSKVYVKSGEKVVAKQAIGKIHTDENDNKTILHLEIWQGNVPLNPETWLAK